MLKSIKIFSLIIFAIVTFATIALAKEDTVPVKISDFQEIQDFYSFSPSYNDISVIKNNRICFTTQGKLYIYDLTKHSLLDNVLLSKDSDDIRFTNWIKLLANDNVLIMQNKEISGKPFDYKGSKTIVKNYSPKEKRIVFEKKCLACQIGIML